MPKVEYAQGGSSFHLTTMEGGQYTTDFDLKIGVKVCMFALYSFGINLASPRPSPFSSLNTLQFLTIHNALFLYVPVGREPQHLRHQIFGHCAGLARFP